MMRNLARLFNPGRSDEGRGTVGCLVALVLLGAGVLGAVELGPPYYAHKSLEADVKTEISRAGANFHTDEALLTNLLALARRNEIRITRENISLERFAGQIHVKIEYSVPVDLFFYRGKMDYLIKASSFIGRL